MKEKYKNSNLSFDFADQVLLPYSIYAPSKSPHNQDNLEQEGNLK
jgi:hypothetical protein